MKNKKWIISIIGLIFVFAIGAIFILSSQKDNDFNTSPIEEENLVYLGNEAAENEILLVFDYSCPGCKAWVEDVLPELEEDYIQTTKAKFRMQSMVYLNDASLLLSKFDQNLKKYNESEYYQISRRIMSDAQDEDQEIWGTQAYIDEIISEYDLEAKKLLQTPEIDAINVTRKYTRGLEIEVVPTVYVNGEKIEDPFNIREIASLIK